MVGDSVELVGSYFAIRGAVPMVDFAWADSHVFVFDDDIIHGHGHSDILGSLSVADMTGVGGGLCGRGNGIVDVGVAQACSGCP